MDKTELKINAWYHSGGGQMIFWDDIDAIEWCNDKLWFNSGEYALLGNVELLRYTGYTDIEGNDIVEGHILGVPELYETPEMGSNPTIYWEVVFEHGMFTLKNKKHEAQMDSESLGQTLFSYDNNVFIAGNIYQNLELLNQ